MIRTARVSARPRALTARLAAATACGAPDRPPAPGPVPGQIPDCPVPQGIQHLKSLTPKRACDRARLIARAREAQPYGCAREAQPYGRRVPRGADVPGRTARKLPLGPGPAVIFLVLTMRQRSAPFTYEEFPHTGKLIAANLDYDLPFIPVVTVISPICIGMCVLLSWFAPRAFRWERRSPETEAVDVAPAEPGTLLPGGVPPTAPTP